jgi:tetratricopeptide (TPR) repeat protein
VRRRLLVLLLVLTASAGARAFAASDPLERARLLHKVVRDNLDDPSLETRIRATQQVQEAIDLDPLGKAGNHWWLLGYLRELGAYDQVARSCYRKAQAQAPGDREVWLGLGRVYKREFLRTLDTDALKRAIAVLDTATRCYPPSSEPWLALCPLLYEAQDLPRAAIAANKALEGHPRLTGAVLAAALMAWRTGDIERADSLFRETLPRLAPDLRATFDHPERYVGRPAAGAAAPGAATLPDPDPTTPQNEVQLEYWSRVAHAYLLFNDPLRPGLDARAETYIRYGPPAKVLYNPIGTSLSFVPNPMGQGTAAHEGASYSEYPLHAQVWLYPDLGMQVTLHDRSLLGHYTMPAVREPLPNSAPDPAVLARRHDLLATDGGYAVFPTLPPPAQRLDVAPTLAAFEGSSGPRLVAFVQADRDSLEARWVVTNATGRTVASGAQRMDRSSCGAGARASSEFSADLPPGRYDVAVSARDARGHRGFQRESVTLQPSLGALSLSDLLLCCGEPALMVNNGVVRLEPLAGAIASGTQPLTAYFEIYHLAAGPDSLARYSFDYRVERLARDKATRRLGATGTFTTWASRDETFKGPVRRQFLSVRIASLPPGDYRLTLTVHDSLAGTSDSRAATFVRK